VTESAFFQDLAVLMAVAGAVSVLFARLRWPKVIGYLLAGILMSEHTWGGAFLVDPKSISAIGQLGVVFLMFTLGLEFSADDMKKVKHVTVPTALFDSVVMIGLGYTAGRVFLGWGAVPSLFLGAAICDSATTLLAKTIDEMKWGARPFVRFIFGTTICEDILCVGVIALVTGVAQGEGMSVGGVAMSLGGLLAFLVGTIVFGLVLVPRGLNQVARLKDDEVLLLTLLGLCFFVSWVAFKLDFSLAMGAFLVGILGASSDVRARLHDLAEPLRNMFAAVFFVTIGVLVDPAACLANALPILALTLLVMVGKGFNCFMMSLFTGQGVKDAVQTGFGLAQIGEFAYMVALLYLTHTNDTSNPIYQIVVGVSLITTCLNPVMLRVSDPVGTWLESHLPGSLKGRLAAYQDWLARFRAAAVPSQLQKRIRARVVWLGVTAVLNLFVAVGVVLLERLDYAAFSTFFEDHKRIFFCLVANLFFVSMLAPAYGLARTLGRDIAIVLTGTRRPKRWQTAVQRLVTWFVMAGVGISLFVEIAVLNVNLQPKNPMTGLAILAVLFLCAVFGWKRFRKAGRVAGYHFNAALAAERRRDRRRKGPAPATLTQTLTVPGDFYRHLTVSSDSSFVGRTIRELDIRARTGASIVSVQRGGERFRNPGPDWRFTDGDVLSAIGEPAQVAALSALMTVQAIAQKPL